MFWILCFHSVCRGAWWRHEIQQWHCSIAPPAHNSYKQPTPAGLSYHCLMQPSGSQYLHKSCSLATVLQATLHFFLQSGQLNCHMQHQSLVEEKTTALWGNLSWKRSYTRMLSVTNSVQLVQRMTYQGSSGWAWGLQHRRAHYSNSEICRWPCTNG